jgi:5-methylcytosine-specific restriction endonuclease McrA
MVKHKNAKKGSSLKGVYLCKKTKKYYAMAHCNKEKYISKLYNNEEDAHEQYKKLLNYFVKNSCKMNRFKVTIKKRKVRHDTQNNIKSNFQSNARKKKQSIKRPYKKNTIKKEYCKRKHLNFTDAYRLAHDQNHLCNICQEELKDGFEQDHIIPLQYGGTNNYTNFQALCNKCHLYKTNRVDNVYIKGIAEKNKNISTDLIVKICRNSYHKFYGKKKANIEYEEGDEEFDEDDKKNSLSSIFKGISKYLPSLFQ